MENLLPLIQEELLSLETTVECPVCYTRQTFEITDLRTIRLGKPNHYMGTGPSLKVPCKHCQKHGRISLLVPDDKFFTELNNVVFKAISKRPPVYMEIPLISEEE